VIVDVHAHAFSDAVLQRRAEFAERDEWFRLLNPPGAKRLATVGRLVRTMDAAGVDVAVALSFGWADQGICEEQNHYLLTAAQGYPGRLLPFCAVQPSAGPAALRELERAAQRGCRGVGELFPDGQRFSLDDRATLGPLLEACAALGLAVLVHGSEPLGRHYPGKGETTPQQLLQLARLVCEVAPNLTVICAHLGGGLPFYELMPEVRALTGTLYYDTGAAGYLYEPAALAHAATIAPGRLLFGSDYPVIGMRRMVDFALSAGLDEASQAALMGGSAARLFGLRDTTAQER
jgi:predicted TIM-barrel fold metal-dependent hydrolase